MKNANHNYMKTLMPLYSSEKIVDYLGAILNSFDIVYHYIFGDMDNLCELIKTIGLVWLLMSKLQ